ncbi:acetolactate synthase [Silicimonas algicola]|uniref:Acetolactate synthase-1/2/3 large subunit n=1 Tax=Silicimonas algicola TaxID=1826607 RepID=A0A316G1C0_9RHOB|nr:acetolactate synthase [Silicimonas algicola]PWK54608.1 acetolactate synthase-1/2/3 large subunit [Silicimonas algicola]
MSRETRLSNSKLRAAEVLRDTLDALGADRIFCVPGESYLAFLDALHGFSGIDTVVCRHEGGAGLMAVADAKLTGAPGVVAVSRGPGATNASIAVHLAEQDAVPLILLVGQVARDERGRGAFQEVDYGRMFGSIAKGVWEVTEAGMLAETVVRAWRLSLAGTPGPVVLALPEDMLSDECPAPTGVAPSAPARTGPGDDEIARAAALLSRSQRPLVIAGSGLDRPAARAALARLAEAHGIPVAPTFKHQEIFDNGSPLFAGHLGFKIPARHVEVLSEADLILAIGTRLGDVPTQGYTLPLAPDPRQPLIHVWPDANVLGRVFRTDLAVPCDASAFCEALARMTLGAPPERADWARRANASARDLSAARPQASDDGLDFGIVVRELARQAPRDAIVVTDAGNFSSWVHQCWPWDGTQQAIGAAGGAMGLGVPGSVAAALRHPGRCVIGFVGDGGVMMTGNELATAAVCGVAPKIVISDNGTYGTIRLHQERDYPNRVSGTDLRNPDFAVWARSFGAADFALGLGDDVAGTVSAFLGETRMAVLTVRSSAEAISAFTTISGLHERQRG